MDSQNDTSKSDTSGVAAPTGVNAQGNNANVKANLDLGLFSNNKSDSASKSSSTSTANTKQEGINNLNVSGNNHNNNVDGEQKIDQRAYTGISCTIL